MQYIRAYMTHGHFAADLDPLKLEEHYMAEGLADHFKSQKKNSLKLLNIENYGFTDADLDRSFHVNIPLWGGLLGRKKDYTLRELRDTLSNAYCQKIGIEYMHIPSRV